MADLYINPNIEVDDDELADAAFAYLESQVEGWEPHGGNLDVWLIEAIALMGSMVAELAQDVPATIFKYYGTEIIGLPVKPASAAIATTAWTVQDDTGYVIPINTQIAIDNFTFLVNADTVIPEGVTVGNVSVRALNDGSSANGLSAVPQVIDTLPFVVSVALVGVTSDGADEETDEDYLDRLSRELQTMGPKLVLPEDVEIFARRIPEVGRALALDTYDPTASGGDGAYGVEKTVTVIPVRDDGEVLTDGPKAALAALLAQYREVNFQFYIIDPDYTIVDITFAAVAFRGANIPEVQSAAIESLVSYLSPARFGLPSTGDAQNWNNTTRVRFGELYAVLNDVEGLDYVTSITIAVSGETGTPNADLVLSGAAPLTRPGVVDGVVTAPVEV